MKPFLFLILLFFFLGFPSHLYSYANPAPAYCQRHGYLFQEEGIQGVCIFPDGNKCAAWAFLTGICGQQYRRPLPCVPRGRPVFSQFETCCRGLQPLYPSRKAEVPVCNTLQNLQRR